MNFKAGRVPHTAAFIEATGMTPEQFSNSVGITYQKVRIHLKKGFCPLRELGAKNYPHMEGLYRAMLQRCYDPKHLAYKHYGERGIKVCGRWFYSLKAFVEDMGPRPEGYQIERIDNNKSYGPDNCRWASALEQGRNKRNSVLTDDDRIYITEATAKGMKPTPIAKILGVSVGAVKSYRRDWL